MSSFKLLTRDIYNNPLQIAEVLINATEERLLNGEKVTDPNSPFIFGLELAASLSAGVMEWMSNQFPALYTQRAQSLSDLYKQLSDYDTVEMFATPAATTMSLLLEKNQLLERAKLYPNNDSQYYMVQIPKDSYITFGKYTFGLYYPINITIAKHTHLVYVAFDGREVNPLHTLQDTNIDFQEYDEALAELIDISLPIYQFETTKFTYDCSKVSGLHESLQYNNQFYAIRIFHRVITNSVETWEELKVVYSETMYDPARPTVIVKVLSDINQCKLDIPQVYFENNMIGGKIKVELYTTLGAIDIDISNLPSEQIKFVIPSQSESPMKAWSDAMNKLETSIVMTHHPLITGGTNSADFSTIKRRIQNRISTSGLLVSPGQLKNHYEDIGFTLTNVKDTLEERIYTACSLLTDSQSVPLQVGMFTTEIPLKVPDYALKWVVEDTDALTVLPTAIYRYDTTLQRAFFINQEEQDVINDLANTDKTALCLFLNDNVFTKSLYHVHIRTKHRTPYVTNYDLSKPKVNRIKFITENIGTSERISIINYAMTHNGYSEATTLKPHQFTLQLTTTCSDGIIELLKFNPNNIKALAILNTSNLQLLQVAEYKGPDPDNDKYHIFHVIIEPNYKFNLKGELGVDVFNQTPDSVPGHFTNQNVSDTYIPLDCSINILFFANLPEVTNQVLLDQTDAIFPSKYKQLGLQELSIKLGQNLHDKLYSSIDQVYRRDLTSVMTDDNYIVQEDEYEVYPEDVYKRLNDGTYDVKVSTENTGELRIKTPELTLVSGTTTGRIKTSVFAYEEGYEVTNIELTKIHSKGEPVLDSGGKPIVKYKAGDVRLGVDNQPLIHPREVLFMANILHVGVNLYFAESDSIEEMVQSITDRANTMYTKLESSANRLLENTYVLFTPYTALGNGSFFTDSKKIIEHTLGITLRFKCQVPDHILLDTKIQQLIRSKVIEIIETELAARRLSVTAISTLIRSEFPDIIKHIDIFGINGNINLQMIESMDATKQPVLKQELWLDDNKRMILNKAVLIQFVN